MLRECAPGTCIPRHKNHQSQSGSQTAMFSRLHVEPYFRLMQLCLETQLSLVPLTLPAGASAPIVQMQECADAAFSEVQHELVWSDMSSRAPPCTAGQQLPACANSLHILP